jgi:hypothetical protein
MLGNIFEHCIKDIGLVCMVSETQEQRDWHLISTENSYKLIYEQ